jgi:hypothetical protein
VSSVEVILVNFEMGVMRISDGGEVFIWERESVWFDQFSDIAEMKNKKMIGNELDTVMWHDAVLV